MSIIKENIQSILSKIPDSVQLVAVTKTKPIEDLMQAHEAGLQVYGENYVQELVEKQAVMPSDIQWHMIGHLQSNKVKYIAPFVAMIHSVDSFKLLKEVNKQAQKNNRVIDCLLQIYIAQEDSKTGMSVEELNEILEGQEIHQFENIRICGLMGMASFTADNEQVRKEFAGLKLLFEDTKSKVVTFKNVDFKHISMGMSGDFEMAIAEGSTMVRVGSAIFGSR
jgi:PLP dependent protein